jgi:hypothetical protein
MVKSTRKDASYCINDPSNRKVCILDDPNLCQFDFYSACLEAHPEKSKKPPAAPPLDTPRNTYKSKHSQPFYDDEPLDNPTTSPPDQQKEEEGAIPTIPIELVGINNSPSPAPPAPETDRPAVIITPYDVNDGIIETVGKSNVTFNDEIIGIELSSLDLATSLLKREIACENGSQMNLAHILSNIYQQFFNNGKKRNKEWKVYIEKTIDYHYQNATKLIRAHRNPLLLEYWQQLGTGKLFMLLRKKEFNIETIQEIIPLSYREAKTFLFPSLTISKQKDHKLFTLINSLKAIQNVELDKQEKTKLMKVLQETLKTLK